MLKSKGIEVLSSKDQKKHILWIDSNYNEAFNYQVIQYLRKAKIDLKMFKTVKENLNFLNASVFESDDKILIICTNSNC